MSLFLTCSFCSECYPISNWSLLNFETNLKKWEFYENCKTQKIICISQITIMKYLISLLAISTLSLSIEHRSLGGRRRRCRKGLCCKKEGKRCGPGIGHCCPQLKCKTTSNSQGTKLCGKNWEQLIKWSFLYYFWHIMVLFEHLFILIFSSK